MIELGKIWNKILCKIRFWKRRAWERRMEGITTAQFYHVSEEEIRELERMIEEYRKKIES